jgi:hypothetical protein
LACAVLLLVLYPPLTAHRSPLTSSGILAAQEPERPPADTTSPPDTTVHDSTTLADSVAARVRDSLGVRADSSRLQRYLAAAALERERVPAPDRVDLPGPLPAASRIILTRDSLDWAHASTCCSACLGCTSGAAAGMASRSTPTTRPVGRRR